MATDVVDLTKSDSVVILGESVGVPAGRAAPPQQVRLQRRPSYTMMR